MEKLGFLKPNVHFFLTARERFTRQAVTTSLKFTSYLLLASGDQVANLSYSVKNLALGTTLLEAHQANLLREGVRGTQCLKERHKSQGPTVFLNKYTNVLNA